MSDPRLHGLEEGNELLYTAKRRAMIGPEIDKHELLLTIPTADGSLRELARAAGRLDRRERSTKEPVQLLTMCVHHLRQRALRLRGLNLPGSAMICKTCGPYHSPSAPE